MATDGKGKMEAIDPKLQVVQKESVAARLRRARQARQRMARGKDQPPSPSLPFLPAVQPMQSSRLVRPSSVPYVPMGHGLQAVASVRPVADEYRPAPQPMQDGAVDVDPDGGPYLPASHAAWMQLTWPAWSWYSVPGSHVSHPLVGLF